MTGSGVWVSDYRASSVREFDAACDMVGGSERSIAQQLSELLDQKVSKGDVHDWRQGVKPLPADAWRALMARAGVQITLMRQVPLVVAPPPHQPRLRVLRGGLVAAEQLQLDMSG